MVRSMNRLMRMICPCAVASLMLMLLGQVVGIKESHVVMRAPFLSYCNYKRLETWYSLSDTQSQVLDAYNHSS